MDEMEIKALTKTFGDTAVIKNFSCNINDNAVTCLFGPSGCGKTTLMNIIAGILDKDSGEIENSQNKMSYIFQDDRLLPWLTVKENISIISPQYEKYLELAELSDSPDKYPEELSGGMRRRLNIARGLSKDYDLLLMDEPFTEIDYALKIKLLEVIRNEVRGKTSIMITHDVSEAFLICDEILMLCGPPLTVTDRIKIEAPF